MFIITSCLWWELIIAFDEVGCYSLTPHFEVESMLYFGLLLLHFVIFFDPRVVVFFLLLLLNFRLSYLLYFWPNLSQWLLCVDLNFTALLSRPYCQKYCYDKCGTLGRNWALRTAAFFAKLLLHFWVRWGSFLLCFLVKKGYFKAVWNNCFT